jgi:serine/threonine-protein kinase RsbW
MAKTSTEDRPGIQIAVPAQAENVVVIRHALAGLAERMGMDQAGVADLKTVVTEACMNVVVHAYPAEQPGPIEVEAVPDEDGLTVAVRDYGSGIRPRPETDRPSLRIGLTLIAALSSSFEIKGGAARGTEIRMHMPLRAREGDSESKPAGPPLAQSDATQIRVGPPEMVAPILSRVIGALAARHEIGVDRLSDTMLLSDAISAGAPQGFSDGHVCFSVSDRSERVEVRVGPMLSGGATRLRESFDLPGGEGSLASLADELRVEQGENGEFLVVSIASSTG